jgi:hypothetical protein
MQILYSGRRPPSVSPEVSRSWADTMSGEMDDEAVICYHHPDCACLIGIVEIGGLMYCIEHDDFSDERNNGDACRVWENDYGDMPEEERTPCELVELFYRDTKGEL